MEVCNDDGMPVTTIGNEMPVNEMPEMTFDNEMGDGAVPDENHQIVNGESYVSQVARTVSFDHPPRQQRALTFENVMPQWPKTALFTQNKNAMAKSVFYAIMSTEIDASDSLLAM